jgi:tetratricopeptide (TPR) repeat protein
MEQLKSIGDEFFYENMFEEAIEKYTLALDFDSDDKYKIYLNRCLSFYKLKKYNKALSDAIKATRLKPDNAKSWGRLGSCLSALGRKSQAIYAFKKAYELEPLNKNYKMEANKEIDLNDSDTEVEDYEDEDDKEEDVKEEDVKEEDVKEEDDKEKDDKEEDDKEEDDKEEDDKEEDDKEEDVKEKNVNTINFIPNIDSMLNNKMVNNMFDKMLSNEELLKKISEQSFQNKMLSYQSNPFEVLKDKEIMTLMTSFFSENKI